MKTYKIYTCTITLSYIDNQIIYCQEYIKDYVVILLLLLLLGLLT